MATSGAYYNTAFNFTYAIAKASDPTVFFTGTFTSGEVKVSKRTGTGSITTANIATLPVPGSTGLMNIALTASEMSADEVTIEFVPSAGDFGARAVSITTEPTPSDILEVASSTVTGVADFKATGFSTFDAASDTVTVGTNNDKTGYSLSQSFPSNFADLAITATTGKVTVGTNDDKSAYTISGTLTTLDALNNFDPATETVTTDAASRTASQADVSSLATSSALATVDSNVDSIKAKTDQLTFTVANQVDANALTGGGDASAANQTTIIGHLTDVKGTGWVSADNLAEIAEDVAGLNGDAMRGTDSAYTGTPPTAAAISDAVWDEALSGHNVGGSTGKALRQLKEGVITVEGSVNDSSATTTTFISNLTETTDGFYHDKVIVFISGDLSGQARHIETYTGSTKSITVSQAFTSAPANADEFLILATHEHSIDEIQAGLATSSALATVDANVDSILADTGTDGVVLSTATLQSIADEILKRDVDNVEATANEHTLATIILCLLESSRSSTTWTIKRSDGVTTHATKTLTLDEDAQPVVGVD